jgi:hypothetical protein
VRILRLLDNISTLRVGQSCKFLLQVSTDNQIWKENFTLHFPTPSCTKEESLGNWYQFYKNIKAVNVGNCSRIHNITIDAWGDDDDDSGDYRFDIDYRSMDHAIDHPSGGLLGEGKGKWGNFTFVGLRWGQFYSFTHIYAGLFYTWSNDLPLSPVFSTLIGKVNIEDPHKPMVGYWKTAWQGSSGTFTSIQVSKPPCTRIAKATEENPKGDRLLGTWNIEIILEASNVVMRTFMSVNDVQYNGLIAEMKWNPYGSGMMDFVTSMVLGSLYGDMLSLSFLWPDFNSVGTAVCQVIEKDSELRMEGRIIFCASTGKNLRYGRLVGVFKQPPQSF